MRPMTDPLQPFQHTQVADIFRAVSRGKPPAPLAVELAGGLLDPSEYEPTSDPSLIGLCLSPVSVNASLAIIITIECAVILLL